MNSQLKGETISQIKKRRGGKIKFPVYYKEAFIGADLGELELSVRAYNGLRRAGFQKVGDLVEGISGIDDLARIRNLGQKSIEEIMMKLFIFHYSTVKPEKQIAYMDRVAELNK